MDTVPWLFRSKYKWTLSRFFEICSWEKFKFRTFLLLIQTPEVFLCGFCWTGFGYLCACNTDSVDYFFSTGFGSAMGAFVGHLLTSIVRSDDGWPMIPRIEVFHSIAYFFAILFGSGTTWQRIVNDTKDYGMNFTESFFFMWSMSMLLFITIITILRVINLQIVNFCTVEQFYFDTVKVKKRFLFDIQLAISIALADAFFVGTEHGYYSDNWLGGAFSITSDTHAGVAMIKSGLATTCGFLASQVVQNIISKDNWIDHVWDESEPDTLLHRLSDLTLYALPEPMNTRQSFVGRMSLSAMTSFKEQAGNIASTSPRGAAAQGSNTSPRGRPTGRNSPGFGLSPTSRPSSRPGSMSFKQQLTVPSISVDSQSGGPDGSITPFAGMSFADSYSVPLEVVSPLQMAAASGIAENVDDAPDEAPEQAPDKARDDQV